VFAYDDKRRLFLNSANMLIPNIQGYSIKTVLAFLNSPIFQHIYAKKFNEVKILKGALAQIPFPKLGKRINDSIDFMVKEMLATRNLKHLQAIDDTIFAVFGLSGKEIKYIKKEIA
jgi:hypothetical protein